MKVFLRLLFLEIALFARSRLGMFWTLAFPLLLLVVQMTLFGQGPSLGLLRLGLVDLDRTEASRGFGDFVEQALSRQTVLKAVVVRTTPPAEGGRFDVLVTVPAGFGEDRRAGRPGPVELRRISPGPAASAGVAMLRGIAQAYDAGEARIPQAVSLRVNSPAGADGHAAYSVYVVTGLLVLVLISTSLMGFAQPVVAAREGGLFRLYHVFPVGAANVLAAWLVARVVITLLSNAVLVGVAIVLYRTPVSCSPAALGMGAAALLLGCAAFLSLGLLIAALSPSVTATTMLCNLLYFPLIFSGDLLLPTGRLPTVVQRALELLPVNALVASLRRSFSGQVQPLAELRTFATLALIAGVCLAAASRHFRWTPRDQS